MRIRNQNHLTSVQYLTQVGNVLNIQVEKVYGYDEWLQALDQGTVICQYFVLPKACIENGMR